MRFIEINKHCLESRGHKLLFLPTFIIQWKSKFQSGVVKNKVSSPPPTEFAGPLKSIHGSQVKKGWLYPSAPIGHCVCPHNFTVKNPSAFINRVRCFPQFSQQAIIDYFPKHTFLYLYFLTATHYVLPWNSKWICMLYLDTFNFQHVLAYLFSYRNHNKRGCWCSMFK